MLDRSVLWDYVYVIGPLAVLSAIILSLLSSVIWSRNVGETSCAWRTNYSPDGRAFVIWGIIYVGSIVVTAAQLTDTFGVFDWAINLLWGLAWACCALWVPLFDAESPGALLAAMVAIVAGAGFATVAAWMSQMWIIEAGVSPDKRLQQLALGWPLTLLAGWLTAASAINVGIALMANDATASQTCVKVSPRRKDESESDYRNRRRVLYREAYAGAPMQSSVVPLLLAAAVAGLATLIRDPLYPLPLAWAILNLPSFPSCVGLMSLLVCGCGSAGAVVRIFL
jgi:hypothetical protein